MDYFIIENYLNFGISDVVEGQKLYSHKLHCYGRRTEMYASMNSPNTMGTVEGAFFPHKFMPRCLLQVCCMWERAKMSFN